MTSCYPALQRRWRPPSSQSNHELFRPLRAGELSALEWALLAGCLAFMGYSEGYRGFQCNVAPRVVVRAHVLGSRKGLLRRLLAPFFCMTLFEATRRRLITAWAVYVGIVVMVLLVRQLHQPLRGIVDAGVVFGLLWGGFAILVYWLRGIAGHLPAVSAELPEATGSDGAS